MSRTLFAFVTVLALGWVAAPRAARADDSERSASYVVKRGQTLYMIAQDVLGDPAFWPAIYWANRDQIKDPKMLHVGQALAIPELSLDRRERARIRREAAVLSAPARKPPGPDVAAVPPGAPSSSTE